jgi:chromate transporter
LPSLLLVLFLYPIYKNLQQHVIIYRALEGIHAVVVGLMWASGFKLLLPMMSSANLIQNGILLAVISCTFLILKFTKVPAPIVVMICLVLGYFF